MKLPITRFLSHFPVFFLSVLPAAAQLSAEDSLQYEKGTSHLVTLYHQASGDQSGIYNGSQYAGYPFTFKEGHPFYKTTDADTGSVLYDAVLYNRVPIQFDELQDVVFVTLGGRRIQLLNERLTGFTIFGNQFIRIVKDTGNTMALKPGFYNLLYQGKCSLLKKEEKLLREDIVTGELLRFVDTKEYYYVVKDNVYYSIRNKNALLNLFKDRKKDLKQYIRKNKLNYRDDRDNMLVRTTAFYDQLTK